MSKDTHDLSANSAYASAGPNIIAKIFDGELTLINLDNGQYFAAGGSAVDIWEIVSVGATPAGVAEGLLNRYETTLDYAAAEANRILTKLLEHELITPLTEISARKIIPPANDHKPWQPGWIEVYGDMKELLLLDPIHDVDEAWPKAKQEDGP